MRKLLTAVALACALLSAATPSLAWNRPGHMLTGAVAFHELKSSSPQTLARVVALLKRHPDYRSMWLPKIQAAGVGMQNHDLFLFMSAARWPDDIRDRPSLHCGDCHFINFPFKPDGQPASVRTKEPRAVNVIKAFQEKEQVLGSGATRAEKAQALSWIFHLVGDVHQPLHTAALFTAEFGGGDLGGNLFKVREEEGADEVALHSFWDGLLIADDEFRLVNSRAAGLRSKEGLRRADLDDVSEASFEKWADESFDLAKREAYVTGRLPAGGAVLPDGYACHVRPIAERRAVLAGYRLADFLKRAFGPS